MDNEDLNTNEEFTILPKILELKISMDEVDCILDRMLDEKSSIQDTEKMIEYITQLFYRSGTRSTSLGKIHAKLLKMIEEKSLMRLEQHGLIELSIDDNGEIIPLPINRGNNESDLQEG